MPPTMLNEDGAQDGVWGPGRAGRRGHTASHTREFTFREPRKQPLASAHAPFRASARYLVQGSGSGPGTRFKARVRYWSSGPDTIIRSLPLLNCA